MILTKELDIILNNRNRKFYKKLLNENLENKESIKIDINKLSKYSHSKIEVLCDFCKENKVFTKIQTYYRNKCDIDGYSCKSCTNLKRTKNNIKYKGVENVFQLESVKNKLKETNNIKYGCNNPQQNKEIHNRTLKTNIEKYGCDNPSKNEDVIKKIKDVHFEKYGSWYSQTEEYLEQSKITNNKKFGVDWTSYNIDIVAKGIKSAFKINEFEDIKYQGSYELDFLQKCKELNLLDKISKKIKLEYLLENKYHSYYPDFFFEEFNLIVEIKSSYIYKLHKDKCDAKIKRCIELGYNYIMIMNKNYNEFYEFLKNNNIK